MNNQAAEGFQRNLKHSFIAGYSYVSPEYAPLYLNEYAAIKNLKHYGLKILGDRIARIGVCEDGEKETVLKFFRTFVKEKFIQLGQA